MLNDEYLVVKICHDRPENEPLKSLPRVCTEVEQSSHKVATNIGAAAGGAPRAFGGSGIECAHERPAAAERDAPEEIAHQNLG